MVVHTATVVCLYMSCTYTVPALLVCALSLCLSGLLFAYGITNSGKTYTMNGEPDQAGILPRSLDIIFNSIADVQAPKFIFRPDSANGFDLFTEEQSNTEAQRSKPKKISPRMRCVVYILSHCRFL